MSQPTLLATGPAPGSAGLHWPAGSLAGDGYDALLTPERAGWGFTGLAVLTLPAGGSRTISTGGAETAVLPLSGGLDVQVDGRHFSVIGRDSVFSRVSDWCYLPVDAEAHLASFGGCTVALASARAEQRREAAYIEASWAPVEVRGAGPATRQITNFMAPEVFDGAERLICVEVLTPAGNWSSYPPHKHDDSPECPVNNEEIYYFRIGCESETAFPADGFALHRTYTDDRSIDVTATVRDGDVFCIPRGFHGPSIAAPGYPLYYLNVLAGPGGERSLAFCDDPAHHWLRDAWSSMAPDPRCPMTTAEGVVGPSATPPGKGAA